MNPVAILDKEVVFDIILECESNSSLRRFHDSKVFLFMENW